MKSTKINGWVGLKGLKIKASVGVYESEKSNGTTLELDLFVFGDLKPAIDSDRIEKSFNYERLEEIAQAVIQNGNHLLEPVANSILSKVMREFPLIKKARIELKKMNPPLSNPCEASVIKLTMKRK